MVGADGCIEVFPGGEAVPPLLMPKAARQIVRPELVGELELDRDGGAS